MKAINRVRLKLFLFDLTFELIVNSAIFVAAWLSNKIIETLLFYLAWNAFRYAFPKVFHVKHLKTPLMNVIGCGICSIGCYVISMQFILPLHISIFSSVLVGIGVNYILYLIADYRDLLLEKNKQVIDMYKMTEDELRAYAHSKGLSEMIVDTLVLKVIHNYRWCEIMKERNYSRSAIKYHKKRINIALNVNL